MAHILHVDQVADLVVEEDVEDLDVDGGACLLVFQVGIRASVSLNVRLFGYSASLLAVN